MDTQQNIQNNISIVESSAIEKIPAKLKDEYGNYNTIYAINTNNGKRDMNLDNSKKTTIIIIISIIILICVWVFFGNETAELPFHQ